MLVSESSVFVVLVTTTSLVNASLGSKGLYKIIAIVLRYFGNSSVTFFRYFGLIVVRLAHASLQKSISYQVCESWYSLMH